MTILRIPVAGGELSVHHFEDGAGEAATNSARRRVVIALHGITANALSLRPLARAVRDRHPDIAFLAPDLAGRACSNTITGPWGIGRHADDVIAVADHVGAETVTLVGHSMGAYVAAVAAARHPERFDSVVLIDGGIAFPPPPGTDIDQLLTAVIGPAMARLSMTFPSREAYRDYMTANPAIGEALAVSPAAADDLRAYLDHDAVEAADGALVSSCVLDAIRVDGAAVLTDSETHSAIRSAPSPTTLLWAPRGLMNQTPGLLTAELIAAADLPPTVRTVAVDDCNHYSILFAEHALAAIAEEITRPPHD